MTNDNNEMLAKYGKRTEGLKSNSKNWLPINRKRFPLHTHTHITVMDKDCVMSQCVTISGQIDQTRLLLETYSQKGAVLKFLS